MSVSREQVMQALLAKLETSGDFKLVGRRNRNPDTIGADNSPALILVEHTEGYRNPSTHQPSIRRLMVRAIVYNDVGGDDNAIPSSAINGILDAIDGLFVPDNMMTGQFTLGGLVQSAVIDGTVVKAPGDMTGKGLAIVPITIVLP